MTDHEFYISQGVTKIRSGLAAFRASQEDSGNPLLAAIIRNIEDQISMIDGRNEIYPPRSA